MNNTNKIIEIINRTKKKEFTLNAKAGRKN